MRVHRVTGLDAYLELVQQLQQGGNLWFRGQHELGLPLIPRVFRRGSKGLPKEYDLTSLFLLHAPSMYPDHPAVGDYPGWLTLMQHFGLPTRLLDWTDSPLTAAYFAFPPNRPTTERTATVYAIAPDMLNTVEMAEALVDEHGQPTHLVKHQGMLPWSSEVLVILGGAFNNPLTRKDSQEASRILAVQPVDFDRRMTAQATRFTAHGRHEPLNAHPSADLFLITIEFTGKNIIHDLGRLNIRESVLFPDLDHLASELARFLAS